MKGDEFYPKKDYYQKLVYVSIFIRLLLGPTIFISVIPATILNYLADFVDATLHRNAGYSYSRYSLFDKFLDFYWYVFILLFTLTNNIPGKNVLLILFLIRSIGEILFYLTKKGIYFLYFPNIFELFFSFYVLTLIFPSLKPFLAFPEAIIPLILITFLLVIPREYVVHVKKTNFSSLFTGRVIPWRKEKK